MRAIFKRRLIKLAEHLERGKLGHKKFRFDRWNADAHGEQLRENGCGYAGCAIGECPFAFPRQWAWRKGYPIVRADASSWVAGPAGRFFGITLDEFDHLFLPWKQRPQFYGGRVLTEKAKPASVARNIRAFIKRKEQEPA